MSKAVGVSFLHFEYLISKTLTDMAIVFGSEMGLYLCLLPHSLVFFWFFLIISFSELNVVCVCFLFVGWFIDG